METAQLLEEWQALKEKEQTLELGDKNGLLEIMEQRKRILYLLMQTGITQIGGEWVLDQFTETREHLRRLETD
jgi:hypothetical protein